MNNKKNLQKIVIVGEGRVGKTSITLRYCQDQFSEDQESTINAFYLEKSINLQNSDEVVNIAIWDTAGQEKFRAIVPTYYHDAVCAILVYDITIKESFDKVKSWIKELQECTDRSKLIVCIAGNKGDLENQRQITKQSAEDYAKQVGAKHFTTSAKANLGINEMFQFIADEIQRQGFNLQKQNKGRLKLAE
ncbi:ras oncogene family protein, putative, partial [Ichthyophthirius multifiliis]